MLVKDILEQGSIEDFMQSAVDQWESVRVPNGHYKRRPYFVNGTICKLPTRRHKPRPKVKLKRVK